MNIHYAYQTSDSQYNFISHENRVVKTTKSDLIKVCLLSFMNSIEYVANLDPNINHIIQIFDDKSSEETIEFMNKMIDDYKKTNVIINPVVSLQTQGIMASIRSCYEWQINSAKDTDLIYQVQDDYLFDESALFEMIDLFFQMKMECDTEIIVHATNDTYQWTNLYRNRPTPRTIISGRHRLWMQYYDMACTFMTTRKNLYQNWDLIEKFLSLPGTGDANNNLENISLNYMLTKRGILGLIPINSLALHLQRSQDVDLYADWKKKWEMAKNYARTKSYF